MIFSEAFEVRDRVKDSGVLEKWLADLKCEAEKYLAEGIENYTLADFMDYYETGERTGFERIYFSKRGRLAAFAMMIYVFNDKRFAAPLEETIASVCSEKTWALPAHIPRERLGVCETWIDLFAAETGFALSEIKYLIGSELSAEIKSRISREVRKRIIEPYLSEEREEYSWQTAENNWSAVCSGSIGAACFYEGTDEENRKAVRMAERSLECFVRSFSAEGICMEGFGYWNYGFGFFSAYAQLLFQYTGGRRDYFKSDRVKNIAGFLNAGQLRMNCPIAFSDLSVVQKPNMGTAHFLHDKYIEIKLYREGYMNYNDDKCFRWAFKIRDAVWTVKYGVEKYEEDNKCDEFRFYPDAQWYIRKTPRMILCAKGGNNAEPHNHNDVGSFYVDSYQGQLLTDPGSGEYTEAYFNENTRYSILPVSSFGHNLPIIGGKGQSTGSAARAEVHEASPECLRMELSAAYDVKGLESFVRKISVCNDTVVVEDCFDTSDSVSEIREHFVSKIMPSAVGRKVRLGGCCEISCGDMTPIVSCKEYRASGGKSEMLYFIDFAAENVSGQTCFKTVIKVSEYEKTKCDEKEQKNE